MMTKRYVLGWALVVALFSLVLTGCKSDKGEMTIETKNLEKVVGQDSVCLHIDFPKCRNKQLRTAIEEFISESLGGTYEGDYADADSLTAYYIGQFLAEMKEIRSEYLDDVPMEFFKEVSISKVYETDKVVTYLVSSEEYSGGAHGFGTVVGTTFRKSDGRKVGLDLLRDRQLNDLLKEGLMEYFEVDNDKDLEENLMGADPELLPLPETAPYFMDEGMVFVYQSYEIACYAAGRPNLTIPYEKILPLMNVTGQRLFTDK